MNRRYKIFIIGFLITLVYSCGSNDENKISSLQNQINGLENQISDLQSNYSQLNTLNQNIKSIENQLKGQKTKINDFENKINGHKNSIETLEKGLNNQVNNFDKFKYLQTIANDSITRKIQSHRNSIKSLEKQLGELLILNSDLKLRYDSLNQKTVVLNNGLHKTNEKLNAIENSLSLANNELTLLKTGLTKDTNGTLKNLLYLLIGFLLLLLIPLIWTWIDKLFKSNGFKNKFPLFSKNIKSVFIPTVKNYKLENMKNSSKITLFIISTIVYALIGLLVVGNPLELSKIFKEYIIYFTAITSFCVIIWYGWLNGDKTENTFLNFIAIFFIIELFALINVGQFPFPVILFWINLLIWVVAGWITTDDKKLNGFDYFITYLFSTVLAISVYITLGYTSIFSYSYEPINQIQFIDKIIDIRLILAIIFLITLSIKSAISALQEDKPEFEVINTISLDDNNSSGFSAIISPIISVIKVIINIFITLINFTYRILVYTIIYTYRIGVSAGENMLQILSKSFGLFKMILIFTIILLASHTLRRFAPEFLAYLNDNELFNYVLFWNMIKHVLLIVVYVFTIIAILSVGFQNKKVVFNKTSFDSNIIMRSSSIMTMAVMFWLAGFTLYLLSQIRYLQFIGFHSIGLYNLVFLSIIVIGLIIFIVSQVIKKKNT